MSPWRRLDATIGSLPQVVLVSGAAVLMALVAWLDYISGVEVSFSIFYLVPIALMAWYGLRFGGIAAALVGAGIWLFLDLLARPGHFPSWIPYWNAAVRLGFFLITVLLLSSLRSALDHMTRMAHTDPLTGLLNGRGFAEASRRLLAAANRTGRPFALLYLDVDDLKQVNDIAGHLAGDRLLRGIAALLLATVRHCDLVARLGGDEFAILLPDTDPTGTEALLVRLFERSTALASTDGRPMMFSVGAVTFGRIPSTIDDAIRAADALMYRVKEAGKNAFRHELHT